MPQVLNKKTEMQLPKDQSQTFNSVFFKINDGHLIRCLADSCCKHNPDACSFMLTPLARRPWASLGHHQEDKESPVLTSVLLLPPFPLVCLSIQTFPLSILPSVRLSCIMYSNAFRELLLVTSRKGCCIELCEA